MRKLSPAAYAPLGFLVILGAFVGGFATLGADTLWAASLGREILTTGAVPDGVPYATLDSGTWVNVPVIGEIVVAAFAALGPVGLAAMQLVCVLAATAVVLWGALKEGAGSLATSLVLSLVVLASLASLVVIRMPVLSLVPWVILIALLRDVAGDGLSRKNVAALLVVLTVWANLHGGVLAGVCLLGVFVLLSSAARNQPLRAMLLGGGGLAVVLLLTVQGTDTWRYYAGALTNEAVRTGTQLWAAPEVTDPLDAVMVLSLVALVAAFARSRPPLWEIVAVVGMMVATAVSARHGVFLALFLGPRAACGVVRMPEAARNTLARRMPAGAALLGLVIGLVVAAPRSSIDPWSEVAASVKATAGDYVVLAAEPLAESVAYAGGRTVMGNPLDAFSTENQRAYLDFVAAEAVSDDLVDRDTVIVTRNRSPIDMLVAGDDRFAPLAWVDDFTVWARRG